MPDVQIWVDADACPAAIKDILYRAATRLELQAPRSWDLSNTAVNRLLWTPEGLGLVGWADTGHLQDDGALDESTA